MIIFDISINFLYIWSYKRCYHMIGVTYYLREEWTKDNDLKQWLGQSSVQDMRCECGDDSNLFELVDHDSCSRGRIDTTVCINCNKVKSFKIVR